MSEDSIDAIVARARTAQVAYEANGSQARYSRAAQAVAWAIMEPARNQELAELAVEKISPITSEANKLMSDGVELDKILENGAERARKIADPIIRKTYEIVGLKTKSC